MRPPFPYPGGKQKLSAIITRVMVPHSTYVEPFVGGGAVYFRKDPAKKSILSDADPNVIRFYKSFTCKKIAGCSSVKDACGFSMKSIKKLRSGKSTEVCEFLAARRFSIAANGRSLHTNSCDIRPILPRHLKGKKCAEIEARIKQAKVVLGDFRKVSKKHDSKSTLFFLDPPYYQTTKEYKKRSVTPEEVIGFAKSLKGKFILTYNDHPEILKQAKGLVIVRVPSTHSMNSISNKSTKTHELLIMNFKPKLKIKF